MIVDLLRNDIGRVAKPGSVHVPKLFDIESFPAVHHLVSTIRAELDAQYSETDLLRACFPGGPLLARRKYVQWKSLKSSNHIDAARTVEALAISVAMVVWIPALRFEP